MNVARTIGLALGTVILLSFGTANLLPAQQPKGTTLAPSKARGDLRESILKLEAR